MMRNIHFFNLKEGADEKRILGLLDGAIKDHTMARGCVERRTLKLLDARAGGEAAESAQYMNESLWPDKETADAAFTKEEATDEFRAAVDEAFQNIEMVKSVRYLDW